MKKKALPAIPQPADVLPLPHPQTPASAAARLCALGLTVAASSRATGINRQTFCALLDGKQQGLRGNAHRAAVLLGLKPAPAIHPATTTTATTANKP